MTSTMITYVDDKVSVATKRKEEPPYSGKWGDYQVSSKVIVVVAVTIVIVTIRRHPPGLGWKQGEEEIHPMQRPLLVWEYGIEMETGLPVANSHHQQEARCCW